MLLLAGCASHQPSAASRTDIITLRGTPVTLAGDPDALAAIGDTAPNFTAVANDMSEKDLAAYRGQVVILSTVPSLDTAVCDRETRTFNERASGLAGVTVLTVSMDLPFAQARWCGAHDIKNVVTLSDFKLRQVSDRYGLRIAENGLLARAVFVLDKAGVIRYRQIVPELTHEPDYDAAFAAAAQLAKG
ncbi:MAG: thiol peroxidase [Phycisphaerales bacterium]|nr:thiol peroxidase [Phycisphaerales bacterium]